MTFIDLHVALFTNKCCFARVDGGGSRAVEYHWVAVFKRICPRPKPFLQTSTNGLHKGAIWMIREKFCKAGDVDRCNNAEKGGIVGDGG